MNKPFINFKIGCLLFIFSVLVTHFNSCDRIEPKPLREFRLSEEQLKWVPYKKNDTIIFINSGGDTIYFHFNGCNITTKRESDRGSSPSNTIYELSECNISDNNNYCFEFYLSAIDYNRRINYGKKNGNNFSGISGFGIGIGIGNDTLKIENKTYQNVYISKPWIKSSTDNSITLLYYNLEFGILKAEFQDNSSWKLIDN